ncbi:DUF397 domain-containing protein [Kitasatospora sp. NPDC004240]
METLVWKRPQTCADGNNCPEVAVTPDAVHLRNTRQPDAVVRFTPEEWQALQSGIRGGEFD